MSTPSRRRATPPTGAPGPEDSQIDRRRTQARQAPSESYLRRRAELTQAAMIVMRRKGYHDMTLLDVATELGADRSSVYYYVAGKEELLADMVSAALEENSVVFAGIVAEQASAAEKVRAFMTQLMTAFDRHFPYLYIWVHEDLSRLEGIKPADLNRITEMSQRAYNLLHDIVADGLDSGEFTTTLPTGVLTQTIIGLVAWTYRWYEPGHSTPEDLAAGLSDLILSGLAPVAPEARPPAARQGD